MSLRDQLLKAGLADKKAVQRVNREKKRERKARQGNRAKRKAEERERAAAVAAEAEARRLARARARKARDDAHHAREHQARVRQIVTSNALRGRGTVPFHVVAADGVTLVRLLVSAPIARRLRCGEAGVAEAPAAHGRPAELVVVGRGAIRKLKDVAPEAIRFHVEDTHGISAPDEDFLVPDWDVSLVPHRVR